MSSNTDDQPRFVVLMSIDNGPWQGTGLSNRYERSAQNEMDSQVATWPGARIRPGADSLSTLTLDIGRHTIRYRVERGN